MIIYVDYDSTLNDMSYAWIEWINLVHGRNYTYEDVTHWEWYNEMDINAFEFFHDGVAFQLIEPLPGSQEFYDHLKDNYETNILTASSKMMKNPKDKHIAYHYGETNVIHHAEKWDYATHPERRCIIIDDRPLNCIKWVEAGGIAFLFNHEGNYKYTQTDFEHENLIKVTSYKEIKEHLEIIRKDLETRG